MGMEAICNASYDGQRSEGKARLEPEGIQFRGDFRLDIPMKDIASADVKRGSLHVKFGKEHAEFELGAADAEKWALKIRYPRSRAQKLGLKAGLKVKLLGLHDDQLIGEIEENNSVVAPESTEGKVDMIFYQVGHVADLAKLTQLRKSIQPAGTIWVVAPKGSKVVRESDVLAACKSHGLTDTKVVSFSDTLTAHKMMIPVASR